MASALEGDDSPLWLRYGDTSTLAVPSNIGQPPQDQYLPPEPIGRENIPMPQLDWSRGDILLREKPGEENDSLVYYGGQKPPVEPIPPSPWDKPVLDKEQGWGSSTNAPVSDEPSGPKYPIDFASPAERGFISATPPPSPSALPPQDVVIPTGPRLPVSALTPASYAGDVLSPYARGNARLGQPSSVEGVGDELARRFTGLVSAMPPEIRSRVEVISGFRDAGRQAQVNPRVTHSRHTGTGEPGSGMALDLGNDPQVLDWIGKHPEHGLGFPLRHMGPKEYNHLEMIDPKTGAREPMGGQQSTSAAPLAQAQTPPQTPSATAADQTQALKPPPPHPVEIFESTAQEYPVVHNQGLIAGPGKKLEYWSPNEPGTPDNPRPDYIPLDQAGMEIDPNSRPIDVLGDIVSHHMAQKDPVIKKYYESFKNSLTDTQKELLQAQYMYYTKNEGETRPYAQWEKTSGLPAYFRGYAFQQWPQDFNEKAYTPAQRYHFDQMMGYLRGGAQTPRPALQ